MKCQPIEISTPVNHLLMIKIVSIYYLNEADVPVGAAHDYQAGPQQHAVTTLCRKNNRVLPGRTPLYNLTLLSNTGEIPDLIKSNSEYRLIPVTEIIPNIGSVTVVGNLLILGSLSFKSIGYCGPAIMAPYIQYSVKIGELIITRPYHKTPTDSRVIIDKSGVGKAVIRASRIASLR